MQATQSPSRMNETHCPNRIRWMAVKIFIVPPAFFTAAAIVFVLLQPSLPQFARFLIQVMAGLGAIALSSCLLAPAFAQLSRRSIAAGCAFGVLVCALGALAFGFSAALLYRDFSVRAFVWRPFFWFVLCGFPLASLTGLLFGGAARLASSSSQPHETNDAS